MADLLPNDKSNLPKDLQIVPQPQTDKDYYNFKATGLKIDTDYAIKFQWVYEDETTSPWSTGYNLHVTTESVPQAPSVAVPSTSVSSIPVTLNTFPANTKRVDIYVIGGEFGTGKIADYFLAAGTKNIAVSGGTYQVSLIAVTPSGINGDPTNTFTITVSTPGETVEAPTNPNGFSIARILSGIEVSWAGTYANGTFSGFEAIKIYVGNSATATSGTYKEAGVMTGNNVKNTIVIPVDGTYLRYDQPVYIHAAAVNKNGTVGTIQQNVASNSLGARSAVATDLADQIITNAKLVDDAVTAAKIATSAITETKIATDAVTSPKIVANAITADKIVSSAITADKIAANAITATKILAGSIDVTKLAAGTISVNNLEAGNISSTSYIRAGTAGSARVEMSSANISGGPSAGFYIYNSSGVAVLSAPLTGGLTINGNGTFSGDISGASGTFTGALTIGSNFSVTSTGILTAAAGTIGGWTINSTQLRSSATDGTNKSYISFNPSTPKIALITGATFSGGTPSGGTESITIDPISGIVGPSITVAGNTGAAFKITPTGTVELRGSIYATNGVVGGWTLGSSTLTGGTLTLNSSGSITSTGTVTGFYGTSIGLTTTFTSGKIQTTAAESTIGYFGSSVDTGLSAVNNTNKTIVNPNGIFIESTSVQNGVGTGGFAIQNSSGDYDIHFRITGALDANNLTQRNIIFDHWNQNSAQRTKDNAAAIYDISSQFIRPLVIDQSGRMYIGAAFYFSTTQATAPSSSTGANGDFFFSTV